MAFAGLGDSSSGSSWRTRPKLAKLFICLLETGRAVIYTHQFIHTKTRGTDLVGASRSHEMSQAQLREQLCLKLPTCAHFTRWKVVETIGFSCFVDNQ
jgi:hypothetical protein